MKGSEYATLLSFNKSVSDCEVGRRDSFYFRLIIHLRDIAYVGTNATFIRVAHRFIHRFVKR